MARTSHYITFLLLLILFTSPATAANSKSHELEVATEEMSRANYFTFVTLINMMLPLDTRIQHNVTFLMPNDRILSTTTIHQDSVADFLLRHSIPSPLLFDHLQHMPSGSTLPSSDSRFSLYINNNGRRSFFLNNVRLISPNLCTASRSVRCHGIDGVLAAREDNAPPAFTCSNVTTPVVVSAPPAPFLPPAAAPQPTQHVDIPKTSDTCIHASFSYFVSIGFMFIVGCFA